MCKYRSPHRVPPHSAAHKVLTEARQESVWVVHGCNSSTREAEAGRVQTQGQRVLTQPELTEPVHQQGPPGQKSPQSLCQAFISGQEGEEEFASFIT